jgi:2-oxoglutarate dehydrogenase E2 component (dihydrolipoamide succinyltransferase)
MGESITEGTFAATLKSPGDAVAVDDVVLQIETDKVTLDVRSPYNGALVEFLVEEGDTVTVGMPLFTIDQSAGACLYLCV